MNQVLYRKYRPKSFSEIKGQENVVSILVESVVQQKVSHAYLFAGPRGCGKTTIARLMAKAINCENFPETKDICNECVYCTSINTGNNIDIIEMDAASNRGIEEIRSLKDTVNFMPNFLKKKVYIIDEAHMLTKEAFNALLKTLEEPPSHVVFILATTEAHKLPITILSRVTRFDFKFGSEDEILNKLNYIVENENLNVEKGGLQLIYRYSGGSFRDAESLLGKIILSTSSNDITLESINRSLGIVPQEQIEKLLDFILNNKIEEIVELIDQLLNKESNANVIIDQLLSLVKDKIISTVGKGESISNLVNLANLIIESKNDLRDFNDKGLILKIEFIKIAQQVSGGNVSISLNKIELEQPTSKVKQPERETVTTSATTMSATVVADDKIEAFKKQLLEDAGVNFPRLKGIIGNSTFRFEGSILVLSNPYMFNINYLSKKEVKDALLNLGRRIFGNDFEVRFTVDANIVMKNSERIEKEEQKPEPKIETKKEPEIQKDNSALVEEIL